MKKKQKKSLVLGASLVLAFVLWTVLVRFVDVRAIGPEGSLVGFATLNGYVHNQIGVNMSLYTITDWLGLVPVFVCMIFAFWGFVQLIKRKSLFKVDADIIITGFYYIIVIVFSL